MDPLVAILIFATFIAGFGIVLLYLFSLVGPKKAQSAAKLMSYECGVAGTETKETKISVKFYLTAILFILFDIEIIFMYPWAITFKEFAKYDQGAYIFVAMMVFILLFIFGLFWEVKSKALEWE